eukprot:scaffold23518_cov225-Skeletonema_marinoi.AAC.18
MSKRISGTIDRNVTTPCCIVSTHTYMNTGPIPSIQKAIIYDEVSRGQIDRYWHGQRTTRRDGVAGVHT